MLTEWPYDVLPCRDISFNPAFRNVRGGASVAYGDSQIVASDAGIWKATLTEVIIKDGLSRKAFRALQAQLEGGLNSILIPLLSDDQPFIGNGNGLWSPWPADNELFFGDGQSAATVAAPAARRSSQISVALSSSRALEAGHHFSLGERLYRVKDIVSQTTNAATLQIWPPLREAALVGAPVELDNPVCRMRLASDADMDVVLELGRWGFPTLSFVEAL